MTVNNRFKESRKKLELTQQEVADLLNISHTTYNRYENGIIEPDMTKLCRLADIFSTSVDYLLMREILPTIDEQGEDERKISGIDIIRKYQYLDTRGQEAVCAALNREFDFIKEQYKTTQ